MRRITGRAVTHGYDAPKRTVKRLSDTERAFILERLNRGHSIREVVRAFFREFGRDTSAATVHGLKRMSRNG